MTGLDFTVDGFSLSGVDAFGVEWSTQKAPGWHDAPPMRTGRQAKAQQSGSWPATGFKGERLVTLSGLATAPDTRAIEAAGRRLAAVLASGQMGDLVGISDFGVLSASVSLEDAPVFDLISDRHAVWQFTVVAPDPLLYGRATYGSASLSAATPGAGKVYPLVYPVNYGIASGVTPGAVTVTNGGSAAYWPRLRIDGPSPSPVVTLVESGAWVRFNGTLLAGQWLDFDLANRLVLLNGRVSVRQSVSFSGDWLAVRPGGGSISWTDNGGSPAALLSVWACEGAYV